MGRWSNDVDDTRHELIEVHCHHLFFDSSDAGILKDPFDEIVHALDAALEQVQLLLGLVAQLVAVIGA